eukprot:CAMPEP_0185710214 /NCGR_PEP_ID=MMETSP1164-20130828/30219_1 /TAXON_ID=1104430 /ORGANISM="Chrysoreinhardia sp, Strain CCMP2950" /LENGTH=443 /DNA_ID=CAMNT_0028377719 /DNA_START=76 /DNA_END=1407 /DNA_ORIENTATION=-
MLTSCSLLAFLAAAAAWRTPGRVSSPTTTRQLVAPVRATIEKPQGASSSTERVALTDPNALSALMAREHEETLRSVRDARDSVRAEYAARIANLESEVAALRRKSVPTDEPAASPKKKPPPPMAALAPAQELTYLEYSEVPSNVITKKAPLRATVRSVERAIGPDAPGDICHVVLETKGELPYVEGQSLGVLPPGEDAKGRPHQQRLYSIASSRYGDDGAGTSVSLCVRRAVFVDPETKIEDPSKKGVCSNFLCDATPGDVVDVTGPIGKAMLLPEDEPDADVIMVATGTGVAPFRGFVRRLFAERTRYAAAFRGKAWLFLGVPTSSSILYPELWDVASARSAASADDDDAGTFELTLAVSREMTNPIDKDGSRCYVQHRLQEHADDVFARLENGAHIYFCGLKGMMPGIEEALERACRERSLDFHAWLKTLKKEKRWHVEVY